MPFLGAFQFVFVLIFVIVLSTFHVIFKQSFRQWHRNNNSPRLTVPATVVTKRTSHSHSAGNHHHTHTHHYVTFEVESGDRMELPVMGNEFGLLVEGDKGQLTFQGTRYLSFERER